jgi:hypothetical protein
MFVSDGRQTGSYPSKLVGNLNWRYIPISQVIRVGWSGQDYLRYALIATVSNPR